MAEWYQKEETCHPAFPSKSTPLVSYGRPFPETCRNHITTAFKSSRVYLIASRSLSASTQHVQHLQQALGDSLVGTHIGISPHTPISEIVDILAKVKDLDIDCIVTLGAGSITDGAKLVRFALANDAWSEEELMTLWGGKSVNPKQRKTLHLPTIPLIHIPTSLSGGEYQAIAGASDMSGTMSKHTFEPKRDPDLVIQDPQLCTTTPQHIWLSSGVRAIDHCVETLCSLIRGEGDRMARSGLEKLVPGLIRCKKDPQDLEARHSCQQGVVEAMCAVSCGAPLGASHAIGHQLGPLGVGHGETSCIALPAVCKFNACKGANVEEQKGVVNLFLKQEQVQSVLRASGKDGAKLDLGDILDLIIRELGMPRTLKDVGVGREHFETLATNSLHDLWIKTNAYPITKKEEILEILEEVHG
ncbi:Dehydroquinate synthase-like protein [Sarocladium strictum]